MNEQPTTLYQDTKRLFTGVGNLIKIIIVFQLALNISIAVHFLMWVTPFLFTPAALNGVGRERQFLNELFSPIINPRLVILLTIVAGCYFLEWKLFVKFVRGLRALWIIIRWAIDRRGGLEFTIFATPEELKRRHERYHQQMRACEMSPAARRYMARLRRKFYAKIHGPRFLISHLDTFPKRVLGIND
jgi:hypothetical protein